MWYLLPPQILLIQKNSLKQHYKNIPCLWVSFQNILLTCSTLRTNLRMTRICYTNHYFFMSKISQLHCSQLPLVRSNTNRFCWQQQVFSLQPCLHVYLYGSSMLRRGCLLVMGDIDFFFLLPPSNPPPPFPPGF